MTWPFENDTSTVIRKLALAKLKHDKTRNIFAGTVILCAACVLSCVFSYAYNIVHEIATETAYQAIYMDISQAEKEKLENDPRIEKMGVYQSVGMTDKENNVTLGLVCSDEATMQLSNIELESGSMPNAANELLIEKGYCTAVGIEPRIGNAITIKYRNEASREMETYDFQIVGFVKTSAENDKDRIAYNAILSKQFVLQNTALSGQPSSVMIAVTDVSHYSNEELKDLVREIGLENGVTEEQIAVNHLYIDSNNASGSTVMTVIAIGIVLLAICAIVIYNIFYISVIGNVTAFGQLRTIGATKKQIRKIISQEGNRLSGVFIPCGCILGYALSFLIDQNAFVPVTDFLLAVLAGLITNVTVMLSIRKPAQIATEVSPIAAFNYTGYDGTKSSKQSSKRLSPISIAFMNLTRNKRKTILTFVSLSLSGMLLMGLSSLLASLDPVERAKQSFPYNGAYIVELNEAKITPEISITDLQMDNPLTVELREKLLALDGITDVVEQKRLQAFIDGVETSLWGMNTEDKMIMENWLIDGTLPAPSDDGIETLIINNGSPELEYLQQTFEVGESVSITINGENVQYSVAAIIFDKNSSKSFILPEAVLEKAVPYNSNSAYILRADQFYSPEIENSLQTVAAQNDNLRVNTLNDKATQYRSVFSTISFAVYVLIGFIFCFSIINLVNTTITNTLSRKKEFGLLRAVGLTQHHLTIMLGFETLFQTLGSYICSLLLGSLLGFGICRIVGNMPGFNFIKYSFPLGIALTYFVIIVLLQLIMTKWERHYFQKNSIIEQIRTAM